MLSHLLSEARVVLKPNLTKATPGEAAAGRPPPTQTQKAEQSVRRRDAGMPTWNDVPWPSGAGSGNARIVP